MKTYGLGYFFELTADTRQPQYIVYGPKGKYVVRRYSDYNDNDVWYAIQLFDAIGCIAHDSKTAEESFKWISERK